MARITVNARSSVDEPLVAADPSASMVARVGVALFRGYLFVGVLLGLLAVVIGIVFLLTL